MSAEEVYQKAIEMAVANDAREWGITFEGIEADALMDPGEYKVALMIGDKGDYHWVRQNYDGTWSHKRGITEVTNLDASGNVIYDPNKADFNYGDQNPSGDNYKIVGYYAITPANTHNGREPQ